MHPPAYTALPTPLRVADDTDNRASVLAQYRQRGACRLDRQCAGRNFPS